MKTPAQIATEILESPTSLNNPEALRHRIAAAIAEDRLACATEMALAQTAAVTDCQPAAPPERYCVIAPEASNRRWFSDIESAVEHARPMLDGRNAGTKVLIVRAERVVEASRPPINIRDVQPSDLEIQPSAKRLR